MKKIYTKPEIMFESFSFSTNIAGDCDSIVGNPSKGTCGITDATGALPIFIDSTTGCVVSTPDGEYDNLCYHVPTEGNSLFNS